MTSQRYYYFLVFNSFFKKKSKNKVIIYKSKIKSGCFMQYLLYFSAICIIKVRLMCL